MKNKLTVGILGATGVIGQHYVALLQDHPWFSISFLAASEKSAGKDYAEVVLPKWHLPNPIPQGFRLNSIEEMDSAECDFVFSALPNPLAQKYEPKWAAAGFPVISSASYHRMVDDVPMVIPEINPSHLKIIPIQQKKRGWKRGFVVVKPNCAVQSFLLPLGALHPSFPIKTISITSLQAISGSGLENLSSQAIHDNVIPYIAGEEEKLETEPLKILGKIEEGAIALDHSITISSHCNRIPVLHGHLSCVSVSFEQTPTKDEILNIWNQPSPLTLPSSPSKPIIYREDCARPQIRLDRDAMRGMGVTVGRLRRDPLFDWRFVALSHNAIRGGAGGGILNAELLYQEGYLG